MSIVNGKVKMSPPWYGYAHQIEALFGQDPGVHILREFLDEKILTLYVDDPEKAYAIEKLLPDEVDFGGTIMYIRVIPGNVKREPSLDETYRKAFKGNPVVKDIETVEGVFTNPMTYISFRKEVVQYYDDNMGDLHGNRSKLMEDIAQSIFEKNKDGIFFCTDNE